MRREAQCLRSDSFKTGQVQEVLHLPSLFQGMSVILIMHTIPAGYLIVNDVIYIAVVSYIFFKLTPSRKKIFRICYLPLTIIALIIDILACNLNDIVLITGTVLLSLLLDRGNSSEDITNMLLSLAVGSIASLTGSGILTFIPLRYDSNPGLLMLFMWTVQLTCFLLAYRMVIMIIERFRPIMDSWPVVLITLYTYISSAYVNFMSDRYFVHIAPLVILFLITQGVFLIILFNFELSRHDELNRQKMQQSEINSLMEYTEKLEREERRLRKFKHDSQNMLLSLRELADFEDRNAFNQGVMKLEEYFNVRFASNEIWGFNDFDNLKNPYVKSIFISKVQDMRNMKITAEFSCPKIIEDIDIPVFDLVRVLGITLDNAVEAVSGNRNGRIAMNIMKVRGAVKFVISNTVTGPHKPVGKLIQEGYTTKSRHQGLGLGNIRDIRKENGNLFVSYKYEEDMFVATITVQQKEG